MKQKHYSNFIYYLIELNIVLLIFTFPLIHVGFSNWFINFWQSLLVIWVLSKLFTKEVTKTVLPPSGSLLLIFAGGILLSIIFSEQIHFSLKNATYFAYGIGLSVVSYDFFRQDEQRIQRTVNYFIASTVLISIDALIQVALTKDILGFLMIDHRPRAFFSHPFFLSLWSGIGVFLLIPRLMNTSATTTRIVYSVCLLIQGTAFLFSKTRAAWLAMGTILLCTFLYLPHRKKLLKAVLILSGIIAVFVVVDDSLRVRALSIFRADDPRWSIWAQYWRMVTERFTNLDWFFGRGPGSFKLEYSPAAPGQGLSVTFPHMMIFELFYTAGFFGAVTFMLWLSYYIYNLLILTKRHSKDLYMWFMELMPLLVFLICLINESFFSRYFSFPFWFFAGISFALLYRAEAVQRA